MRNMRNRSLAWLLLAAAALGGQTKRGVTPEDYYRFVSVSDPRIAPNGKLVAYVQTKVDEKRTGRESSIWLADTDGAQPPRRFAAALSSNHPRWRPDGSALAYLAGRQVYLAPMNGGEPQKLTSLPNGVTAFAWSPEGARIALVSRSGPNAPETGTRHYLHSTYKYNGRGYFDRMRTHLWVLKLDGGELRQLTSGDYRNDQEPVWSPDGTQIAFTAEHTERQCCATAAVYRVMAAGGEPRLIADKLGKAQTPRWSPDGKQLVYAGEGEGGMTKIQLPNAPDLDPTELAWSADGKRLFFTAPHQGEEHLFSWMPGTSAPAVATTSGERAVRGVDRHEASGLMAYTATSTKELEDLYVARLDGSGERRLTNVNAALWRELHCSGLERIRFRASDGLELDGFFLKPLGWQPGTKYPMVLSIHGGPASMYGVNWNHEFQAYAAKGWAVFYANPRGSSGYGEKFERLVELEWGGKAYTDLMSGVDAVLQRHSWIDPSRLGVTGGSYGGFMTNWMVTQTQRFKAAVTLRSISNFVSIEGTRDAAYSHAKDFGGDLYQNFDLYWKYSAVRLAAKVKTPTLILHSDNDQRVPLEQGEQWFRALQRYGVTSEFVIFPGADHDLTRTGVPRQLVESLNWQSYWFDRFLNGNAAARRPVD